MGDHQWVKKIRMRAGTRKNKCECDICNILKGLLKKGKKDPTLLQKFKVSQDPAANAEKLKADAEARKLKAEAEAKERAEQAKKEAERIASVDLPQVKTWLAMLAKTDPARLEKILGEIPQGPVKEKGPDHSSVGLAVANDTWLETLTKTRLNEIFGRYSADIQNATILSRMRRIKRIRPEDESSEELKDVETLLRRLAADEYD